MDVHLVRAPARTALHRAFFLLMAGSLPFEGVGGGIPDRMRTEPGALHLTVGCILALYSPVVVFVHLLIAVLTPGFHLAFVHVIYLSPAFCFLPLLNRLLVLSLVLSNLLFCCRAWSLFPLCVGEPQGASHPLGHVSGLVVRVPGMPTRPPIHEGSAR